jgi:hypothetical protein
MPAIVQPDSQGHGLRQHPHGNDDDPEVEVINSAADFGKNSQPAAQQLVGAATTLAERRSAMRSARGNHAGDHFTVNGTGSPTSPSSPQQHSQQRMHGGPAGGSMSLLSGGMQSLRLDG